MIRRLILVTVVAFFTVITLISSPASVNAAGFLDRFQGTQQSNQKAQEEQYPQQAKYPPQDQYAQDKQVPQMQQVDQGKDGKYSYSKNQLKQPDAKSSDRSAQGQLEPSAVPDSV
jgi:hypothetical protein